MVRKRVLGGAVAALVPLLFADPALAQAGARGIDVAKYQGQIDWGAVASSGISFGIARVSDGLHFPDGQFQANWSGMKSAGLVRGVYQFYRARQDPVAQADLLIAAVGQLEPGDLPPFLDVEVSDGASGDEIATGIGAWIQEIQAKTGLTHFTDRRGNPLHTLQDYLAGNAPFVSTAMDTSAFPYGTKLRIRELEQEYGQAIDFRVVDTGGAFRGRGTSRIDVCTASNADANDATINGTLHVAVVR